MVHFYGLKEKITISLVTGYVLLLGIGTFAEFFDIQSILEWSFWRPPGKY